MTARFLFSCLLTADPRRTWESRFLTPTPRLKHRLASLLLLNPREGSQLQAGSFLIANSALGGESSSKKSSFLRPLRFETNKTAPHERHGTPLNYRTRPQVRNVRYGLPQFPIFRPNRQPMLLIFLFVVSYSSEASF